METSSETRDRAVLVVDDDSRLTSLLQRHLASAGYTVEVADSGESSLAQAERRSFDAVVLDLGMPGMDGIEVCRQLRKRGHTMPVLMLTARADINARVTGLDAGADDYMVKPFSLRELDARLRAMLRRDTAVVGSALEVGSLRCSVEERRAWRHDCELRLSPREFELLAALMQRPGIAVDRTTLLEQVWPDSLDTSSNVLDQYVRRLRAKIDEPFAEQSIETVRGVGYRMRRPSGGGGPGTR